MIDLDLQGQVWLESQILPHFEPIRTLNHQPFKLESPQLDRKCTLALLRSLLILDLIGFDLHFHFQYWNLFFYQIALRSFCIIFSETRRLQILVRPSQATDRISLGFWLNISFVVNYRGAFRPIVDLLISEDRYFLWITAVPLPPRCLQSRQHSGSRMRGVTLALNGPPNLWPESDHRYLSLLNCSTNPLRPQNCICLQSDLSCLYKLNCNILNHHERLFFLCIGPQQHSTCSRKYVA